MWNYLFIDYQSGEEFFVQEKTVADAQAVAIENFGNEIQYLGRLTDEDAEWLGYDTY